MVRIVNQGKPREELDKPSPPWYTQLLVECLHCEHSFYLDEDDIFCPSNTYGTFSLAQERRIHSRWFIAGTCPNCSYAIVLEGQH